MFSANKTASFMRGRVQTQTERPIIHNLTETIAAALRFNVFLI